MRSAASRFGDRLATLCFRLGVGGGLQPRGLCSALHVGCCSSSPTPTAVGAARGAWNLGPGRGDGLGCLKLVGFSFKSLCALVLQSVKWRDLWLSWRGAEEV